MSIRVLKSVVLAVLAVVMLATAAVADVNVTVSNSDPYAGFMNVFELNNAYLWGSGWGTADLCANWSGSNLILSPNTIGDPNEYWYTPSGQPGCTGNKLMEANLYVEQTGPWAGTTLTFSGTVLSNTLTAAHVAKIFIRDFAPDFSSVVEQALAMPASGAWTISLATINDPARHVQYGFQMKGPCVWYTDLAPFGNVVIGPTAPVSTHSTSWGTIKNLYR
jgi:hypothetical protein